MGKTFYVEGRTVIKFQAYVESDTLDEAKAAAVRGIVSSVPEETEDIVYDFITGMATEFDVAQRVDGDALIG